MRMIISSSDGRLYPRQKCSIHSKMVQEDKLPTAMPFFPHSFFVYLKSFMQVKGHSKGARITHSRYSVSHIRIPSTASIQKPDKILAAHIAGFPFDDPRKLMSPRIVNPATFVTPAITVLPRNSFPANARTVGSGWYTTGRLYAPQQRRKETNTGVSGPRLHKRTSCSLPIEQEFKVRRKHHGAKIF